MKRLFANLGLLIIIVPPIWFGLMWVLYRATDGPQGNNQWPVATVFYFLVLVPQLLVGGLLQQLTLLGVPKTWSMVGRRALAILTTLLIPTVLLLFGGQAGLFLAPITGLPLAIGLLTYGFAQRLPPSANK